MATKFSQYRSVAPASVEQRRAPRHQVQVTRTEVRTADFAVLEAALHDVSVYGCRFVGGSFGAGERLWLRFSDSPPIAATVVWSDNGQTGCRFDKPIDRRLMRDLTLTIR